MKAKYRSRKASSLILYIALSGLVTYSSHGLSADEVKVNCGWAATDLVLQSYGAPLLNESSTINKSQATFSLEDTRRSFVEAGFQVNTYRFRDAPQSFLRRLSNGSCRGILLAPVSEATQFDTVTPGHYFFVSDWSPESLQVIDPISVESHSFKSSVFANDSCEAYIQFVTRPLDGLLYAPVWWKDSIWLAMLPISAILIGMVIRPEVTRPVPSSIAIGNEAPLPEGL